MGDLERRMLAGDGSRKVRETVEKPVASGRRTNNRSILSGPASFQTSGRKMVEPTSLHCTLNLNVIYYHRYSQ